MTLPMVEPSIPCYTASTLAFLYTSQTTNAARRHQNTQALTFIVSYNITANDHSGEIKSKKWDEKLETQLETTSHLSIKILTYLLLKHILTYLWVLHCLLFIEATPPQAFKHCQ